MHQSMLFDLTLHWTVGELTRHLRQLLESDAALQGIWVKGEISNLSHPSSGHLYFTLKDTEAQLRCVMWRKEVARLLFVPEEGMACEAHGNLSIYEAGGQYQLYADTIRPMGEGALYQEFLRLKALLEARGWFADARKRPIPERPHRIGIVTSPTGAALQDILNTLQRRNPLVEVVLAPSPVQGEEAPAAIVKAVQILNHQAGPDVILLARGGGSLEDLWAFNDARVVQAVVESQAPVIAGVGHETDITLVDFAADLRAPTPTAAAEMATPITINDLKQALTGLGSVILNQAMTAVNDRRSGVADMRKQMHLMSPLRRLQSERQRLDDLSRRAASAQFHRLILENTRLKSLDSRLFAINPMNVLKRGYAVVTRQVDGKVVANRAQVTSGDDLRLRVQDGEFMAQVTDGVQE